MPIRAPRALLNAALDGSLRNVQFRRAPWFGFDVPVSVQLKNYYDLWGSEHTYNHMAVPWSWAFDTPFKWTKQISSYFGGTRQGMAIAWPKVITDKGGIRNQFAHVIDIAPTILEAAAIREPSVVDGIAQSSMEGSSLVYTFDAANANAPARHLTQYFEMFGNFAIYHDGWMLVDKVSRPSWVTTGPQDVNPAKAEWELYDINTDWTQSHDVAARHPDKVKELEAIWWREAKKYNVMPLDASVVSRLVTPRPSTTAGRSTFTFPGRMTGISNGVAPSILNASYTFTAEVTVPQGGGEGMIITQGGRFTGYGLFVNKGKPTFVWNLFGLQKVVWEAADPLAPGKHTLVFDFNYDGLGAETLAFNDFSGIGQGGTGELKVDGAVVATQKMKNTVPLILAWDENMDVGSDTGTPVDDAAYAVPFAFTGTIDSLKLTVDRPQLSDADRARLEQALKKASE